MVEQYIIPRYNQYT